MFFGMIERDDMDCAAAPQIAAVWSMTLGASAKRFEWDRKTLKLDDLDNLILRKNGRVFILAVLIVSVFAIGVARWQCE